MQLNNNAQDKGNNIGATATDNVLWVAAYILLIYQQR